MSRGGHNRIGYRHSDETRAKISAARVGQVIAHSEETRDKMSESRRLWHLNKSDTVETARRRKLAEAAAHNHAAGIYHRGPTSLELVLRGLLQTAGFEFEEQVRFGRYVVDAWVPSHGLVFEADCSFWYHHQDKEREARRDAYLVDRGVVAVVHLTEDDLR